MKLNRIQTRQLLMREARLILEEVVDNSKLAKYVVDLLFDEEYSPAKSMVESDLIRRLDEYPALAQELLQFLDTPGITGAAYSVDLHARNLNDILSKYMDQL